MKTPEAERPAPPHRVDQAAIGWWLPHIAATGVLTPTTQAVAHPADGIPPADQPTRGYWVFLAAVLEAAEEVGFPFVLRTDRACPRHLWESACLVTRPSEIDARVRTQWAWCLKRNLAVTHWAVQQLVPLAANFTAYEGLPVGREFRVFLRDGEPLCVHPYWPLRAVELGRPADPFWPDAYASMTELKPDAERKVILNLARRAAINLPGDWAIDWAATCDGRWMVSDASPGELAWHQPDCPHHPANPLCGMVGGLSPDDYAIDPDDRKQQPLLWHLEQCLEDSSDPQFTPQP
jgi:hypothetical protein